MSYGEGDLAVYVPISGTEQQIYFCLRNAKPACAATALILMEMRDDGTIVMFHLVMGQNNANTPLRPSLPVQGLSKYQKK